MGQKKVEGERGDGTERKTVAGRTGSEVIKLNNYQSWGYFFLKMTCLSEMERDEKKNGTRDWEATEKNTATINEEILKIRQRRGLPPSVPLFYLGEASLAVGDVGPVFASQAVRQFILPNECSVLCTAAALQPSCTLGNNATHHLGYTQVHLQQSSMYSLLFLTDSAPWISLWVFHKFRRLYISLNFTDCMSCSVAQNVVHCTNHCWFALLIINY